MVGYILIVASLIGGTVRYFIDIGIAARDVVSGQILIALVVTRKTKKKIIKIGLLLTKWRQFP